MRILLSAFGCSPSMGSEPGVGWRWAQELSASNDVIVVTHPFFEEEIRAAQALGLCRGVQFYFYEPRGLGVRRRRGSLNSRLYYLAWQIAVSRLIRTLVLENGIDVVQHLTWGTFRLATWSAVPGCLSILGPVGGGEVAPMNLFSGAPLTDRLYEWLRLCAMKTTRFDLLLRWSLSRYDVIVCKTEETTRALPVFLRERSIVAAEIGAPPVHGSPRRLGERGRLNLLYAGRLISLKGLILGVRALAQAVAMGADVRLALAGAGPLRGVLEEEARQLGISERLNFLGQLPRSELAEAYRTADVFLFPSLHDSSGNVVLEAMAAGCPVICLDLGGPPGFVDETCGRVVCTRRRAAKDVICDIGVALHEMAMHPERVTHLSEGALCKAARLTWKNQVDHVYAEACSRMRVQQADQAQSGAKK